jgi:hypothetical protein
LIAISKRTGCSNGKAKTIDAALATRMGQL